MKKITLIQSSLRQGSHTSVVCREFERSAKSSGLEVDYIDLKDIQMEFCDGRKLEEYSDDIQKAYTRLEGSDVVVFGMPVYQYSMSGVLKNFIDICGGALQSKYVAALVNAGGPNCYMASRDLFDCLYYEYQTSALAPTPYTWWNDFQDGALNSEKAREKIEALVEKIHQL